MKHKIFLVFGLSGTGKTTLADKLASEIGATRLNADKVRDHVNTDLDFSEESRIEQAYRMGMIAMRMALTHDVVVDFICPTDDTRDSFQCGSKYLWDNIITIWMNTEESSQYKNTDDLFEEPESCTWTVTTKDAGHWIDKILERK